MSSKKHKNDTNPEFEENNQEDNRIEIEREGEIKSSKYDPESEHVKEVEDDKNNTEGQDSNKIEELQTEISSLKDQLLRKAAEFENYRRRTEADQANFVKYAGESVISKLLPVYDDLRRSIEHADSQNIESLKKGIELVYNKFTRTLNELGVEKIESKGKEFDFNLHEALMQKEAEDVPPHTVIEEIEPGYMFKDKVLRHAKVIVSQESSK